MQTLNSEIVSISFDGIEQLSDMFLFSLKHCKLDLNFVKWVSITGKFALFAVLPRVVLLHLL